jgi:hypothetical protein
MFRDTFLYTSSSLPTGCLDSYPYGFGGQEKDDEIAGNGNMSTADFWEYDTRLGRRWNIDPKPIAAQSNYAVFDNSPIWKTDPKGDTTYIYSNKGIYKGVILDKLKTNEVVIMSEVNSNAIMGLKSKGKYSNEIVATVARDPKFADARFTENTVKDLTKLSTSSSQESAGLLYADNKTKEVKVVDCPTCKLDPKDVTAAGEADAGRLVDIEQPTASKGKILGMWHTHPENTFAGTQPSADDYSGNERVDALQGGGIGVIVNDKTITLYQIKNFKTGTVPQSSENAKNDNLLSPKFDKKYPSSAVRGGSQHAVFNKQMTPQTKWKK